MLINVFKRPRSPVYWSMNPYVYKCLLWDFDKPAIRRAYRKLGRGRNVAAMKQWWFSGGVKELSVTDGVVKKLSGQTR